MKTCKVCSKECNGNTCSGSCRAKLSRRTLQHQDGEQTKRTRTVETEAHAHGIDKRTQPSARTVKEAMQPAHEAALIDGLDVGDLAGQTVSASLDHYESNPDMYASRTDASTLNWSTPVDAAELKQAGFTANRRPIPGDHDYSGVGA